MSERGAAAPARAQGGGAALLAALDRWLGYLETALTFVAALAIFALMLLGVAQVLGRKIVNLPVHGYIDIVELTMAAFAFLGAAYAQRLAAHVRMEIVLQHLKGRTLWTVEALTTLVALAVIGVIIVYSWGHFVRAWEFGDSTMDIELPLWPSKLIVPAALSVLWLRLLLQFAAFLRLVRYPDTAPVAVPEVETVERLAEHEAGVVRQLGGE